MGGGRTIQVYNRQRGTSFDLKWLRRAALLALREVEWRGVAAGAALEGIAEIEASVLSDRAIADVHRQFMQIDGATDVITFEHGEIVIGVGTAVRQAGEFGQRLEHELALYVIHGLLHLNGYDDLAEPAASVMKRTQGEILERVLGNLRQKDASEE